MKWLNHEPKARVIYSLTTDQHFKQESILILKHKKCGKGKCILQIFPVFHQYEKKTAKTLTVIELFTYFISF